MSKYFQSDVVWPFLNQLSSIFCLQSFCRACKLVIRREFFGKHSEVILTDGERHWWDDVGNGEIKLGDISGWVAACFVCIGVGGGVHCF